MEKGNAENNEWMRESVIQKVNALNARDIRIVYYFLIGFLSGGEKGK